MKKRLIPEVRPKIEKAMWVWAQYILPNCTFKNLREIATCILKFVKELGYKIRKEEEVFITNNAKDILEAWHQKVTKCLKIIKSTNNDKE